MSILLLYFIIAICSLTTLAVCFISFRQQTKQAESLNQLAMHSNFAQQKETQVQSLLEERFRSLELTTQKYAQDQQEKNLMQGAQLQQSLLEKLSETRLQQNTHLSQVREQLQAAFSEHQSRFDARQLEALKFLQDSLQKGAQETRTLVKDALLEYSQQLGQRVEQLTATTDARLKEINQQVEKRLAEGFEKTTETFGDVIKRLALIDAAQQKITELSNSVMSLNDILNDKRSRGTFGEVQLSALIRNVMPEQHFSFQHTLSNSKRPDCILFLPEPTGNVVIDAKFPLENFRPLLDNTISELERRVTEQQFRVDIKKHIQDIAEKYLIPGETADGAIMFIPAEAIFAEIHAHFPDLVEIAQRAKVWLVSPTTLMAILTTARAVLKDAETRTQLHIIQKHLHLLAADFERFRKRMDKLTQHISQAHSDVEQVHTTAKKISQRFTQIEKVELVSDSAPTSLMPDESDELN